MNRSTLTLVVASLACLLTFAITRQLFRDHLKLGPPNLLAASFAGLAFVGLAMKTDGWVEVMILPYAAFGLTLLLLFLLAGVGMFLVRRKREPSDYGDRPRERTRIELPERRRVRETPRHPERRPIGRRDKWQEDDKKRRRP